MVTETTAQAELRAKLDETLIGIDYHGGGAAGRRWAVDALMEVVAERERHHIEVAWGVIANVDGGDWDQSETWKQAAHRWYEEAKPYAQHVEAVEGGSR